MRHQKSGRKFSRPSAHRNAMFSNKLASLIIHEKIETTEPNAVPDGSCTLIIDVAESQSLVVRYDVVAGSKTIADHRSACAKARGGAMRAIGNLADLQAPP